jgi:hypothetical protein
MGLCAACRAGRRCEEKGGVVKQQGQITEATNRALLTALFLKNGWMVYKPEADIGGVDMLVMRLDDKEEVRKVQLKSRWTIHQKYLNKKIWICFPDREKWYFCKHDEMIAIGRKCKLKLESPSGDLFHTAPQLSRELQKSLEEFVLK